MRVIAFALVLASAALPATAQNPAAPKPNPEQPPATERKPATLDDLFDRLAKAKDETEGKGIAFLIERRWARSGSETADLLLNRAAQAVSKKEDRKSVV